MAKTDEKAGAIYEGLVKRLFEPVQMRERDDIDAERREAAYVISALRDRVAAKTEEVDRLNQELIEEHDTAKESYESLAYQARLSIAEACGRAEKAERQYDEQLAETHRITIKYEQSLSRAREETREACKSELDHRAFLCHAHDDFGKGREQGLLDAIGYIEALALPHAAPASASSDPNLKVDWTPEKTAELDAAIKSVLDPSIYDETDQWRK